MTHTEALALIHAETGESGLHVAARMGEDLDPTRVARLASAIRVVADGLRGADSLDRELAASLHILGFLVSREAESWASRTQKLPKAVFDSLIDLESAVEDLSFDIPDDTMTPPNALHLTRRERRGCNRCVPCAGSLSSPRWRKSHE